MTELLTIHEIADKLKVPISWIYTRTRQRTKDTIPHLRVGKYLRFEEAEIIEWLKERQSANPQ